MIEAIMYFGIGFLFASLIGVAVAPLIHDRAVRLTMRRLENSIPQSMAEIQADKDLLRAEFAMSTRRLEIGVEELKEQNTNQLAELSRRGDMINRLKLEREVHKVETVALKSEVQSLRERLHSVGKRMKESDFQRGEPDVGSLVPNDLLSLVVDRPSPEAPPPARVPDVGRPGLRMAEDATGSGAIQAQSSIHVSADDQVAHESVSSERIFRNLRSVSVVALFGVGAALVWLQYGGEGKKVVGAWISPLTTEKGTSTPQPSGVNSAEVTPQIDALARDLADMRTNVEQSTAKQEQTKHDTPAAVEPDDKQKLVSAEPQDRARQTPYPETKPTTIAGWALVEVVGGTAVVQGPSGVWRVTRGDTVPGIGKVDSIVRWGNRWIVATSSGLISTP
ncbi:MAG TPA: hypothetical protein VGJ76_13310 [Pseudolabrys sp.]|jgi:hypothetical protein